MKTEVAVKGEGYLFHARELDDLFRFLTLNSVYQLSICIDGMGSPFICKEAERGKNRTSKNIQGTVEGSFLSKGCPLPSGPFHGSNLCYLFSSVPC